MIPIADNNPTRRVPVITWALLLSCIAAFVWQLSLGTEGFQAAVHEYGVIPAALFGAPWGHPELPLAPVATVFTSMFLHGGLLHLVGNMLFLYVFANNIEDSMGHGRFLLFYALCGAAAALTQGLMAPDSTVPMVGASGAISGVLGAYLILHPFAWVKLLVPYFVIFFIWLPAWLMLGLWFGFQLLQSMVTPADQAGVAFGAHAGGFVAGMILIPFFRRRGVPLFR